MINYGLVLSGGGAKGAYQVGALKAALFMTCEIDRIEEIWQSVSNEIQI